MSKVRLHFVARLLLAIVFLIAGGTKLADSRVIVAAVDHLLPPQASPNLIVFASSLVVAWEIFIGLLLLLPPSDRSRGYLALLLGCGATLVVFTISLVMLALDPRAPSCGCLGALAGVYAQHESLVAAIGIVRNLALLWIAFWLFQHARGSIRSAARVHTS